MDRVEGRRGLTRRDSAIGAIGAIGVCRRVCRFLNLWACFLAPELFKERHCGLVAPAI